jgi:hypothetical protein
MRTIGITSTAVLALLLGIAAPAYARQGQQGEKQEHQDRDQQKNDHSQGKPEQQHGQSQQHGQQRPSGQQQQAQHQQHPDQNSRQAHAQSQPYQHQEQAHAQPQAAPHQQPTYISQQHGNAHNQHSQQNVRQAAWQQHRSQSWHSDHRTWQQRGGYSGYRIPEDRFRGYFGPSHGFRINGLPFLVVGGYPRFQYNGYWLTLVDPWPENWANNWYDTDDVYVGYANDGYYLYDRRHPSVGIAINISL